MKNPQQKCTTATGRRPPEPEYIRHGFAYLCLIVALSASVSLHGVQAQRIEEAQRLASKPAQAAIKQDKAATKRAIPAINLKTAQFAEVIPLMPYQVLNNPLPLRGR